MPLLTDLWQLLTICYTPSGTQVTIVVTTDFPCHLFMRWSLTLPRIHPKTETRRGLSLMSDHYYCFDVFIDNEQDEAGDTTTHTFVKPNWPQCQTRFFYFFGTRAGNPSPSESCIFKYHNPITLEPVPSGECYLLTNCVGYGKYGEGYEPVWCFIPVETFSTNHFRLWLSNGGADNVHFDIIGRIWDRDPAGGPPRNILGEHTISGLLPFPDAWKQMDFTFPLIELEKDLIYFFGFLNQYQPYDANVRRRHSADQSNCFHYRYYKRIQNPDMTFGPWDYASQYLQPCHQFFIDP